MAYIQHILPYAIHKSGGECYRRMYYMYHHGLLWDSMTVTRERWELLTSRINIEGDGAVARVEVIVTVGPGQGGRERRRKVEYGVGDDHVVVDAHYAADRDHAITQAWWWRERISYSTVYYRISGIGEYRKESSPSSRPPIHSSICLTILAHSSMMTGWIFFILGTIIRYLGPPMHVKKNLALYQIWIIMTIFHKFGVFIVISDEPK